MSVGACLSDVGGDRDRISGRRQKTPTATANPAPPPKNWDKGVSLPAFLVNLPSWSMRKLTLVIFHDHPCIRFQTCHPSRKNRVRYDRRLANSKQIMCDIYMVVRMTTTCDNFDPRSFLPTQNFIRLLWDFLAHPEDAASSIEPCVCPLTARVTLFCRSPDEHIANNTVPAKKFAFLSQGRQA